MASATPTPSSETPLQVAVFEPTGDLEKDYLAYCEIQNRPERDAILDAISFEEFPELETQKVRTKLFVRSLEYCLHQLDFAPLAAAIPHCYNLLTIRFTSAGLTDVSYKLLVQAAWKSASVVSVWVDFNKYPGGLVADPIGVTDSTKPGSGTNESGIDPNGICLIPAELACGGYPPASQENGDISGKVSPVAGKAGKGAPAKKGAKAADDAPHQDRPVAVPSGFHGMLLTNIQELSLRGNDINDDQLPNMCKLLECHQHLLHLNLWGNCITDKGAEMLAEVLRVNRKLTALNVGNNQIGDDGAKCLAKAFKSALVDEEAVLSTRTKIQKYHSAMSLDDLPAYPCYEDLRVVTSADGGKDTPSMSKKDDKAKKAKDIKPPPGKGKGPGVEAGSRAPGPWDQDIIKMTHSLYIVPGNQTLWSLNISNNKKMTKAAVGYFTNAFNPEDQTIEAYANFVPVAPKEEEVESVIMTEDVGKAAKPPAKADKKRRGSKDSRAPKKGESEDTKSMKDILQETPLDEWPRFGVGESGCPGCQLERLSVGNSSIPAEVMEELENTFARWKHDRQMLNAAASSTPIPSG